MTIVERGKRRMDEVHIATTRLVRPGMEGAFEAAIRDFARQSLIEQGTTGVHLIRPIPGTHGCEYGILRSFENEAASRTFYESDSFKKWQEQVAPLVVGKPFRRKLHGLEAFFRERQPVPPPRWKMAIVTWLGVFPTVLFWTSILPNMLGGFSTLAAIAISNVFVVVTLTWAVMPFLTRLFTGWLRDEKENAEGKSS